MHPPWMTDATPSLCSIFVLTFSDGGVVANFADLTPDIPYPAVSEDTAFAAVYNGSFPVGATPAWDNPLDDVTISVINTNDVWSLSVFTTFNTTREWSAPGSGTERGARSGRGAPLTCGPN